MNSSTRSHRRRTHGTTTEPSHLSLPQIIEQNSEQIHLLEKEYVMLRNAVAAALLTIAELRAQLSCKQSAIRSSRYTGHQLTHEAGKLKQELTRINQRCQSALLETAQRLEIKNEEMSKVRAEIDQVSKRSKLAQKEYKILVEHLEQRDKQDVNLRMQYSLTANWSVRQAGKPAEPAED